MATVARANLALFLWGAQGCQPVAFGRWPNASGNAFSHNRPTSFTRSCRELQASSLCAQPVWWHLAPTARIHTSLGQRPRLLRQKGSTAL